MNVINTKLSEENEYQMSRSAENYQDKSVKSGSIFHHKVVTSLKLQWHDWHHYDYCGN